MAGRKAAKMESGWKIGSGNLEKDLFHHFAGLDTAGANSNTFRFAIDTGVDRFKIYIETPVGQIVGVADSVTVAGFLSADFANLCH